MRHQTRLIEMRAVDLFAGCGGMSLGFQNSGFNIVAAYENWQPAVETYQKNFDHPVLPVDLSSEEAKDLIKQYSPELIIGGPPCQDFSIAGDRNCLGKRANLTLSFAEIISDIKPQWFVMENVYNIEKSQILPLALEAFRKAGYGLTSTVLDASYIGVPQARKRYFLIGNLGASDNFLAEELAANHSSKPLTVKDYLGDEIDTDFYYMHPRSYNRRGIFSVHEPSSTIRGVNRPMPGTYKKHSADKSEPTENVRALTTKERSYIQTFPKDFVFSGTKTAMEQQIGNAVPVKMAKHVAMALKRYMEKHSAKKSS